MTPEERQAYREHAERQRQEARRRQEQWSQEVEERRSSTQAERSQTFAGSNSTLPLDATGTTGQHTAHGPAGVGSPAGPPCNGHQWVMAGRGALGKAGKCSQPIRFLCLCGAECFKECYSAGCDHCEEVKRGDLKAVVRSGAHGDHVMFATLTAPGEKPSQNGYRLRWNRAVCGHAEGECSGDKGCVVLTSDAAAWNAGAAKRWSYFRQFMRRELHNLTGRWLDVEVVGSWELQKRGALHRHFLFRVVGPVSQRNIARAFHAYRRQHDYGTSYKLDALDLRDSGAAARCAGYVAKYVMKGYGDLRALPVGFSVMPQLDGSLLVRRRFRCWSASRQWGDTLTACRHRRAVWARAGGSPSGAHRAGPAGAAGGRLDPYLTTSTLPVSTLIPAVPSGAGM